MNSTSFSFLESQSYMIDLLKEHPLQTAGVVAVGTALYALYSSSKDKEAGGFDKIPTPKGKYPYIGHIPHLGPILHIKIGVNNTIFISDPIIAHEIFNINGRITSLRPLSKFGNGVYNMNGRGMIYSQNKKKLKEARLAVNAFLEPKSVDQIGDRIQAETSYLVDRLIKNGSTNEGVDPLHDTTFFSLNVILRICFGTRMNSIEDPTFDNIVDIVQLTLLYADMKENIDTYLPALGFIRYLKGRDKRQKDFINNLRNPVFRKLIKEAIEKDEDCVVKIMKNSEKKDMYDEDDILMVVSEMMVGGTDPVSVILSWAFAFLSHHPEVQRKMCEEIDAFIAKYKRLPTFKERNELPYMISVQREIMRLYPVTPYGVPHVAEEDFVVRNYMIKKGTTLLSDMYSMHRNPDVYPDPEKFIPERFINNKSTLYASANGNVKERDQYNFGWGRRICPGIYLAETNFFFVYTTLWSQYTIEPALDTNGNPVYADIESFNDSGAVVIPKPYKVRFIERPDKLL
ncbi:cytochrome P450 [Spinellus fusiger]|nr:cytochrome P450 [Spinellus fusiger]